MIVLSGKLHKMQGGAAKKQKNKDFYQKSATMNEEKSLNNHYSCSSYI